MPAKYDYRAVCPWKPKRLKGLRMHICENESVSFNEIKMTSHSCGPVALIFALSRKFNKNQF